jgi:uncharacterized protein
MNEVYFERIAREAGIKAGQVKAAAELLQEGGTVPFIARYRKEATGALDEVQIATVRDRLEQLAELDKRREAVMKSLAERELLTDELKASLEAAETLTRVEDLYLPFRPKRRTRASIAVERGLEPLAVLLLEAASGKASCPDPASEAARFVDPEKGVPDADAALAGARDIVAERASEDPVARHGLRGLFVRKGVFSSRVAKGKEEEGAKYRDYFDWKEPAVKAPSHRLLAAFRGEAEGFLALSFMPPEGEAVGLLEGLFVKADSPAANQVKAALADGYARLAGPSMETELRAVLKKKADEAAVAVFAQNIREVLMESPLGQRSVLAVDPGIRTGCKLAVLDAQGRLLETEVIYPLRGKGDLEGAARTVAELLSRFPVEAVAVGNGTGGRETEAFLRGLDLPGKPVVVLVNESGASVYSASQAAREEFPDHDLTVRGAVSIGRRLQDPLAELVKIDPKSIGVGQYQHDVDQKMLKTALDDVVSLCVNRVGVEVNTASRQLLTAVSGVGPALAASIVAYRQENGPFASRSELRKVPKLGPKAFQQAAGFLRVRGGTEPLDASAVHPESYGVVKTMAKDLGCTVADLMANAELRKRIEPERYLGGETGAYTLKDILEELEKPGRDPRESFEAVEFSPDVREMSDLREGMELAGVVTNVTAFGAFVDIGVHQDGLVHVSQLADRFVKNPADVVRAGQKVRVRVVSVDAARKRIGLSMKGLPSS